MRISDLLVNLEGAHIEGKDMEIKGLSYNTSEVRNGYVFFCIEGFKTDGHLYAKKAVELGAAALVISKEVDISDDSITKIMVNNTREAMAVMAANYYGNPSSELQMIGITGTNGKTTSTFMMKSILDACGRKSGLLGTIYNIIGDRVEEAKRTTPESMDLQNMLAQMKSNGVDSCIMEVSSHSLELKRVFGTRFKAGIFTNLTQDHLDFHENMENYFNAKLKLFQDCEIGIINIDDAYVKRAVDYIDTERIITFGVENKADVYAENIVISGEGTTFDLCCEEAREHVKLHLPGKFNVYNALGCAAAAIGLGISLKYIKMGLEALENVPGRSEKITTKRGFVIVIDYAHSPDGIINILKTAREYTRKKLITIFGCGGDRDRAKRPLMGKAAGELSDYCIVTSDNPRSEEPMKIIDDILPGINPTKCPYVIIENRKEAIMHALEIADQGDVVVIAGKGHETYQVLKNETIHFDEREIVKELLGI